MAVPREPITDAELDVLKALWADPPLTAREITEVIYGDPTPSNIATVQKLIQRLEAKNCVRRDRSRYVHRFSARVSQAAVAGKQLEILAKKVSGGSLVPLITHLVQAHRLSDEEKEQIRRLLDE